MISLNTSPLAVQNWGTNFLSKLSTLAKRRKLEDLTVGPILTVCFGNPYSFCKFFCSNCLKIKHTWFTINCKCCVLSNFQNVLLPHNE